MSTDLTDPAVGAALEWDVLFAAIKQKGAIPDRDTKTIQSDRAVFQSMYLNLAVVKNEVSQSGFKPKTTTLYCDVLEIPQSVSWSLDDTGLVIYARLLICGIGARINLDFQSTFSARFVLFTNNVEGVLNTYSILSSTDYVTFPVTEPPINGGVLISYGNDQPTQTELTREQGLALILPEAMLEFLRAEFLYGAVMYDEYAEIALDMMLWLKDWSGLKAELLDTFYRASSLVTLLSAQINAQQNGATYVPYLSKDVYTSLVGPFVAKAQNYESQYLQLNTVKQLTEADIQIAEAMRDNKTYEGDHIDQVTAQAKSNYENAVAASAAAYAKLVSAQREATQTQIDFEFIGVPLWEREKIAEAIISLGTAVIEFAVGIGSMFVGNEAGGAAAAGAAANSAKAVANAANTASEIAKLAKKLEEVMNDLEKAVEALTSIASFLKGIITVAQDISKAESTAKEMEQIDVVTDGADLSATYQWQVYQLNADAVLEGPIEEGIKYADELKIAIDEVAIYGQAYAAAQLAEVETGQEYANQLLQVQLAKLQQERLDELVNELQVGQETNLQMMQDFYIRYIDTKSSLFAVIKGYQAAYFYWALSESSIQPKIIDNVDELDSGLESLTAIALDQESALKHFNPPPQPFVRKVFEITDEEIINELRQNQQTSWTIPIDAAIFLGDGRVRLTTVRVWIEGANPNESGNVRMWIYSEGNYLDRFSGLDYQFTSSPFQRIFEYEVKSSPDGIPQWTFQNGEYGYVVVDGRVDEEVKYAYFEPTPFGQWRIEVDTGSDLSNVSKISMEMQGSLIGEVISSKLFTTDQSVELVLANQAAMFTVPKSDWEVIDARVEAALSVAPIADEVAKTIHNIHDLIRVCTLWRNSTFYELQTLAGQTSSTAILATTSYQMLANITAQLEPNQPLTEEQKAQVVKVFDGVSQSVNGLYDELQPLSDKITEFVQVNSITDAELEKIKESLGPDWSSIAPETTDVGRANNLLRGAWGAVAADLSALARGEIPITTPFMLSLDLQSAILGWESVGAEASEFIAEAKTIQN